MTETTIAERSTLFPAIVRVPWVLVDWYSHILINGSLVVHILLIILTVRGFYDRDNNCRKNHTVSSLFAGSMGPISLVFPYFNKWQPCCSYFVYNFDSSWNL